MRFCLPHSLDLDALRGELAIGTVTREEACAALAYVLDTVIPAKDAEIDAAEDAAEDAETRAEDESARAYDAEAMRDDACEELDDVRAELAEANDRIKDLTRSTP